MSDPLLVDLYQEDVEKDLTALIAAGQPWCGVMLKATQGNYYHAPAWFQRFWTMAKATPRYGVDWFRMAYHFLDATIAWQLQRDFYLREIAAAGGWDVGDLYVCVDVEPVAQHLTVTKSQVEDCCSAWVEGIVAETGRDVVLYGGSYLRDLEIVSHMNCKFIWPADYGAALNPRKYTDLGFVETEMLAWQYAGANGDGSESALLKGYPHTTPEGNADISAVVIDGGGAAAVARMRQDASRFSQRQHA